MSQGHVEGGSKCLLLLLLLLQFSTESCEVQQKHRVQSLHKRSHRRGAGEAKQRWEGGFWGSWTAGPGVPSPAVPAPHGVGGWWCNESGFGVWEWGWGSSVGAHQPGQAPLAPQHPGCGWGQTGDGRTKRKKQSGVSNSRPLFAFFFFSFFSFFSFFFWSFFVFFYPFLR